MGVSCGGWWCDGAAAGRRSIGQQRNMQQLVSGRARRQSAALPRSVACDNRRRKRGTPTRCCGRPCGAGPPAPVWSHRQERSLPNCTATVLLHPSHQHRLTRVSLRMPLVQETRMVPSPTASAIWPTCGRGQQQRQGGARRAAVGRRGADNAGQTAAVGGSGGLHWTAARQLATAQPRAPATPAMHPALPRCSRPTHCRLRSQAGAAHRALHKGGGDDQQQQLAVGRHPPDVAAAAQVGRQLKALLGGRRGGWRVEGGGQAVRW